MPRGSLFSARMRADRADGRSARAAAPGGRAVENLSGRGRGIGRSARRRPDARAAVWAWRPGRAREMRSYVDHVLALLPFEPAAHARLGGPPCSYVGHPVVEEAGTLRPNDEEARRRQSSPPLLLVLPGSRTVEIRRHSDPFEAAIKLVAARCGPAEMGLPTVAHLHDQVKEATARWNIVPRIVVDPVDRRAAFRNARAALASSG